MVTNFTFKNDRKFVRNLFSIRLSKLIAVTNELGEDISIAEKHMAKSGEFIISIQVGSKTERIFAFRNFKEFIEEMGGELTPITLIATEDFRGLIDK